MEFSKKARPVPKFPAKPFSSDELRLRRTWLEEVSGAQLSHVGLSSLPPEQLKGNIENPIGSVQMPLGIAGPLLINGQHAKGNFYVPLATTEGALVASYERGMALLTRVGGVSTLVYRDQNEICPVFEFESLTDVAAFVVFVRAHVPEIKQIAEQTTRHGKLLDLEPFIAGLEVQLSFQFQTGDAHGMNMIANAADAACRWLIEKTAAKNYLSFSGLSSEKRPSGRLMTSGKGKGVVAAVTIPAKWVRLYLRTTPEQILELWRKTVVGNLMADAIGYCGHFANGLTALFIACGQDVANIMNSAVGITQYSIDSEGNLKASVTLPSLTVATVGGGTGLGSSLECLKILDCAGTGKALKFAEIAAATALAGELSFAGALCSGEFVQAHESLGRNRPNPSQHSQP
jgi:hydroxymethylglutaryl-CoA reductase (NADPH)